jgi:hypothetical protein
MKQIRAERSTSKVEVRGGGQLAVSETKRGQREGVDRRTRLMSIDWGGVALWGEQGNKEGKSVGGGWRVPPYIGSG